MRLEPFSAWPAPWDPEVRKVFQFARELGVPRLRVKVKLGTLRVQEGGESLRVAIKAADHATQTICPVCGRARARQTGVTLQFCGTCESEGESGSRVQWIEQIDPNQPGPKAVPLSDVDTFTYPTDFTVISTYEATGEGFTAEVLMAFAHDADGLRALVNDHIDSYFASHAEYYPQLVIAEEMEDLVPPRVKAFVYDPDTIRGNFVYHFKYHLNQT